MTNEEQFKRTVSEHLGVDIDRVTHSASLIDDLGADSLDCVELVMAAEEIFNFEISDEEAEQVETFGDAMKIINAGAKQ
jgi:acyl carrier protein